MNRSFFSLAFVFVVSLSFNAFGKKALTDIGLKWTPTSDFKEFSALPLEKIMAQKIKVEKFADKRNPPLDLVGKNTEEEDETLLVTTNSDIAEFVTEGTKATLKQAGLTVADDAAYTLSGEITDYFVAETNTYKGRLHLKLTLKKAGKVVWQGTAIGTNSRFGRSYKLDNYLESLSDVIVDSTLTMMKNESFQKAF